MRRMSIGMRWTLRYTGATMLVVLGLSVFYYQLVERQVRKDAHTLLELQVNEIREAVERDPPRKGLPSPGLVAYVDQHLDSAHPDLRMGIRLLDHERRPVLERGLYQVREVPVPARIAKLAATRRVVERDVGESFPHAVMAAPLADGYVEVAVSTRPFLRGIRDLRNSFLMTLPVALLLTGALGWWLAHTSLVPIARISQAARRISASQLAEEIPTSGAGDELDALAHTLNEMRARIGVGVERIRSFSSTAAHQLRTPLSVLRSRLEIAAIAPRDVGSDQALIEGALRDVERLADAVRGMLRLAESEGGLRPEQRRPVRLTALLQQVVDFFEPVAAERGIKLRLVAGRDVTVVGDAEWLNELFSNLVDNALRFTPPGGEVELALADAGSPGQVAVAVRDTGPGIPEDRLERIFERFERGPGGGEGEGAGLGLTIAREIARAHGGGIRVASVPGEGSTFTAWLPVDPGVST